MIGEKFGGRQPQYEWFYAGDPLFNRARFYRSHAVGYYKGLVERLLGEDLEAPGRMDSN